MKKSIFLLIIFLITNTSIKAYNGDATIVSGNTSIKTFSWLAGAIGSFQWKGKEFIDIYDHGREVQTAWQYGDLGECLNPTHGGNTTDGTQKQTSTSQIVKQDFDANSITTVVHPAYYLPPNGTSNSCNFNPTSGKYRIWDGGTAVNTTLVSPSILQTNIKIGVGNYSNVISYSSIIDIDQQELSTANSSSLLIESPSVWLKQEFNNLYYFDISKNKKEKFIPWVTSNEYFNQPPIASTTDGEYAIGLYSKQIPWGDIANHKHTQFLGYGINDLSNEWQTVFLNIRIPYNLTANKNINLHSYIIIGSLNEVENTMKSLIPFTKADINSNSKVDIFDYNVLVSNFGNPYTIFDYNTLVANFGKQVFN